MGEELLYQQQDMKTVGLYMRHIRSQAYGILETQQIDVLASTPILLQALAPELKERNYRFSGLMYGGTQLSSVPRASNSSRSQRRPRSACSESVSTIVSKT